MKTSQKGFIVPLLLIIIAILVVGGGAYVFTQTKPVDQSVTASPTVSETSTTQVTNQTTPTQTSNSQTADWKTYINTKYGFSFKYPNDFEKRSENPTSVYFAFKGCDASSITEGGVGINNQKCLFYDVLVQDKKIDVQGGISRTSIQMGTVVAEKVVTSEGNTTSVFIQAQHNGKWYVQSLAYPPGANHDELDTIAQSFKFTSEQNSLTQPTISQTVGWKTYSTSVYSFKYPPDLTFSALSSNFTDMTNGVEADIPVSYNLPNSFQRSQKIYVGVNGSKSKEECMPTQPSTSSAQYSEFVAPITVDGRLMFNKYKTALDCAMDGCSIGNTYTLWSKGMEQCFEVSWFAIQSSPSKAYNSPTDPRTVSALKDAQITSEKITALTEEVLSTLKINP